MNKAQHDKFIKRAYDESNETKGVGRQNNQGNKIGINNLDRMWLGSMFINTEVASPRQRDSIHVPIPALESQEKDLITIKKEEENSKKKKSRNEICNFTKRPQISPHTLRRDR